MRLQGFVSLLALGPSATAQADPVTRPVARLYAGLTKLERTDSPRAAGELRKRVEALVEASFDVRTLARSEAGDTAFSKLAPPDRSRLIAAIRRLLAAHYAASIEPSRTFAAPRRTRVTETEARVEVASGGAGAAKTVYTLHRGTAGWRITAVHGDVLPDGLEAEIRGWFAQNASAGLRRLEAHVELVGVPAAEAIARLQRGLIAAMRTAKRADRRRRLAPLVDETHDFAFMSRFVAGRHFRKLADAQRRDLKQALGQLAVTTYVARFDSYNGETFESLGQRTLRGGYRLVKTRLSKSTGKTVSFHYQMRRVGHRWLIANIIVDGVSDLATKRAEYGGIIEHEGFAALLEKIRAQIEQKAREGKD